MRTLAEVVAAPSLAVVLIYGIVAGLARGEEPEATPQVTTGTVEIEFPAENSAAAKLSTEQIEHQVLELLSAGKQSEAESLLAEQVALMPESLHLTELLSKSENIAAGLYFVANRDELLDQQRVLFLAAACTRSRFDKEGALTLFNTVYAIEPETAAGQCALCMMKLDTMKISPQSFFPFSQAFIEFRKVLNAHPDDIILRWMMAVECRTWHQNAEGAELYRQILEKWNPGPALVHQTYANLLDDLERYEDALKERYLVVQMEPASWSYDGLGNTLDSLERYKEGRAAHLIAVSMNPYSASHWVNWGYSLCGDKEYDEAIGKCQKALELNPRQFRAYWVWGKSLVGKGDLDGALSKYEQALEIYPGAPKMAAEAAAVRASLAAREQADLPAKSPSAD